MASSTQTSRFSLITYLRRWLATPTHKTSRTQVIFWFVLSLTCAVTFGWRGLQTAFSHAYVVQDDARQHIFWMRRFLEPDLFPNDLIADYFQSIAPWGYQTIYHLAAAIGIDPMVFNKLLPMALGLITTGYCFAVCLQLFPIPAAGFVSTLLLNQSLWYKDDLVSGTARAFMYPLFLAFLYYLLRRSLLPCLIALALQGLFYPSGTVISAGILFVRLWRWDRGKLRLSRDRKDYLFCFLGVSVALLVLLPLVLESSQFGPAITVAEARTMPEFADEGRSRFFLHSPFEFWLYADRSGFFPYEWARLPFFYFPLLLLSLGFLFLYQLRHPSRFPLLAQLTHNITILPEIGIVSTGLYIAAHALLFKLYLPSRYSQYSIRFLTAFVGAIAFIVLLDAVLLRAERRTSRQPAKREFQALILTALLCISLFFYPVLLQFTGQPLPSIKSYEVGQIPELYKFLSQQPKDTVIASLIPETDNLPSFTKRSILVSRESALSYHKGYYTQIRQRAMDLIEAQYSPDIQKVRQFINKYELDFWIVEPSYLVRYTHKNLIHQLPLIELDQQWLNQFPTTDKARKQWEQEVIPALSSVAERCSVLKTKDLVVLKASCIIGNE
jgi:hypothetical protein